MSTDELERLERRLEAALHEADDRPVDEAAGRFELHSRLGRQQQHRRWTVVGIAASVLAVIVTTSLVVAGLRDDHQGLPVAPPKLTLSPSGLPVGVLEGTIDRTEPGAKSTVRIVVRPDGSGIWNAGTTGDSAGPSTADYEVEFVSDGPGHVVVRTDLTCVGRDAFMLDFSIRGRTIRIGRVTGHEDYCLASPGLMNDMDGAVLRVRPLPLELSPSGLPIGLLEGTIARTSGETAFTTFRLRVRPDGTGTLLGGGGTGDELLTRDAGTGYEVELDRLGPGRAAVRHDGPGCLASDVVTLDFTLRGRTLTVGDVQAPASGCPVTEGMAADLVGAQLRVSPLPPGS
jgi:hypothetical protein